MEDINTRCIKVLSNKVEVQIEGQGDSSMEEEEECQMEEESDGHLDEEVRKNGSVLVLRWQAYNDSADKLQMMID